MAGLAQFLQTLGDVNVAALADGTSPEWNAAASEFQFVATVSIDDAGTTTDAWSAAKIIAYVSNRLDGLDYQADVLNIQVDATLDPGATPTTGDRYIITDSASLHANFGTITGIGNNDIVEYDGADFVVIYDVSVEGEGAIVWDRDSDAFKKWTGSTWSDLTTAGESNTASNVGASGIGVFEQKTGVDLELRKIYGLNGIVSSLNSNVVELKLNFPGLATRDAIDTANDKIAYYSATVGEEVITDIENFLSYYVDTTPSGGGACCLTTTTKTANYTAQDGDLVACDTSAGAFTVTLPAAPADNDRIAIALETSGNILTVSGDGKTIAGHGSAALMVRTGQTLDLQYSSAADKWITLGEFDPPGIHDLTDGATVTIDQRLGDDYQVTLAGNRTVALSNPTKGQSILLRIVQDGTGSRLVSVWPATVKWPGGTAPTLTTTANSSDWVGFKCIDASTPVYHGFVVGQEYAA